jgi:L-amino acid N-acyltransferase YncA
VIRDLRPDDWPEVAAIYAAGIETRNATFETEVPPFETWDVAHLREPRLVAADAGRVVGWARSRATRTAAATTASPTSRSTSPPRIGDAVSAARSSRG